MALSFAHHKEATFKDGCLSLRKNVLDKMREQNGPGPIYSPAPRVSSKEKSLRNIIFGTGPARYNDEPKYTKRRIRQSCHHPGPQTYDPDAIRNAICHQSKQRSAAGVKFGSSKRYDDKNNNYPSPAEYDPDMIRRGIMFSKSRSTSVKFGTARNSDNKRSALPGPASYDPDNIRKGIMFTKSTMPSVKFGNPPKKMSTKDNHKKYEERNHTPGPQGTFLPISIAAGINLMPPIYPSSFAIVSISSDLSLTSARKRIRYGKNSTRYLSVIDQAAASWGEIQHWTPYV
jgi:hypothetical protein